MNTKQKIVAGYILGSVVVFLGAVSRVMHISNTTTDVMLLIGTVLTILTPIIFISLYYRNIVNFFKK